MQLKAYLTKLAVCFIGFFIPSVLPNRYTLNAIR